MARSEADQQQMLEQLRRFIWQWLKVFEECSVDPINCPKRVVSREELDACETVGALASLTLDRLKSSEVRFISSQRDQDQKILRGFRAHYRRTVAIKDVPPTTKPVTPTNSEIELTASSYSVTRRQSDEDLEAAASLAPARSSRELADRPRKQCCPCTWIACGRFSFSTGRTGDSLFPRLLECICLQVRLISQEHFRLLLGSCFATLAFIFEVLTLGDRYLVLIPGFVYGMCLVVLLVQFERIDVIQKLEREVNELQAESERIAARREQMVAFWNNMQQLTDLWVHRTVPRLDLLKELQGLIEYAPIGDMLAYMAGVNSRLEDLEARLPELSLWRKDGELSEESKKMFAERILRLCQEENLQKILSGLSKVMEDGLPKKQQIVDEPVRRPSLPGPPTNTVPRSFQVGI